jgi:hypothetical protein
MDETTLVRQVLDDAAAAVDVRPPSRVEIDRGLRRVRRRRRLARSGRVAGCVAGVAASLTAVQFGLVPLPSWAPAIPVTSTAASALAAQPTRGSLAGDEPWLQALRANVATVDRQESGGERWRAPSADRVDVIYAGDVGDFRIALVETPLRWGAIEARQQIWYVGARHTTGDRMESSATSDPEDVAFLDLSAGNLPAEAGVTGAAAVLLGPASDVETVGPVRIAADGEVSWPAAAAAPSAPGLWEFSMAAGAPVRYLRWAGSETVSLGDNGWGNEVGAERAALLEGVRPAQRSAAVGTVIVSAVPDDERLARSVSAAQRGSSLAVASSTRRLVWSGRLDGASVDVVAVTAPSGASVFTAVTAAGPQAQAVQPSTPAVVAAGGPVALAWSFQPLTAAADGSYVARGPVRVGLVGPVEAVTARLRSSTGASVTGELVDGVGIVALAGATTVTFLGADGATLASTTVSALTYDDTKLAPADARP